MERLGEGYEHEVSDASLEKDAIDGCNFERGPMDHFDSRQP